MEVMKEVKGGSLCGKGLVNQGIVEGVASAERDEKM